MPILTEVKEFCLKLNDLEEVLESGHIEDVENAFNVVNGLHSFLKARELPLSIIPRLQSQIDLLAVASDEKIQTEWNKSVLIENTETGARLFILDDSKGNPSF